MQLKAIIKNIAKEKHISAQLVMQNFMLERLLERISVSEYQRNFILKGGFLIAAMVGLDTRATMDMDATIKGLPINEQTVREMFEEVYNLETIMAEKLETVISRGDQNTRPRDYYDIYILDKLQSSNIEFNLLKAALNETVEKRGSTAVVRDYGKIIDTVRNSEIMKKQWDNYKKDFEYAMGIAFEDTCDIVVKLMDEIAGL